MGSEDGEVGDNVKRLIVLDISPATETHCGLCGGGRCPGANSKHDKCRRFRLPLTWDGMYGEYLRLPECIAAEKAQKENR